MRHSNLGMGIAQTSNGVPDVSIDFIYDKEEQKGTMVGFDLAFVAIIEVSTNRTKSSSRLATLICAD